MRRKAGAIGPAPLLERLEIYWRPLLYGLVAGTALTVFVLCVKFGWPPKISPRGWVVMWCFSFGALMLAGSSSLWTAQLWFELAVLGAISVTIILLVVFFAVPAGTFLGFIPPVMPITPVYR